MRIEPAALASRVPHYSGSATVTGTTILLALVICVIVAVVFARRRR
jgi:hypothetical protein